MFDLMKQLKILKISILDDVEKIDERLFAELCNLEELVVEANVEQPLSLNRLNHLKSLRKITVKGLNLTECNTMAFKHEEKTYECTATGLDLQIIKFEESDLDFEGFSFSGILDRSIFGTLKHLRILNMDSCNLEDEIFNNDLLADLAGLEELCLSGNSLEHVNIHWFRCLFNLKLLSLEFNRIVTIDKDSFTNLSNLQELNLSCNAIEQLQMDQFISLKHLKNLILFENPLQSLHEMCFNGLDSMEELDLRSNKIASISSNDFKGLNRLNILLINNQKTRLKFDPACLKNVKNLKILFIDAYIDLKSYIFLENIEICLYTSFNAHLKKLMNCEFLIEKDFDAI